MTGPEGTTRTRKRCAVYTRKSTEEGLDQDYNSIDAQRDAGAAYIASQRSEGWISVADDYDDPAYSGGNMERPALKRLLADIEAGKLDIVVVYKIDRLTRSLADFSKMIEVFERHGVSFVSVTQQFNTTTSMGRLMLNILLSFAQFEREVTGERIRDKIAASKARGMWMGGVPPLGYDVVKRKLVVNEPEAAIVRRIFTQFPKVGSATLLVQQLRQDGARTKSWKAQSGKDRVGKLIDKSALYKILHNPIYTGKIQHKGVCHAGEHTAIVTDAQWDAVQQAIASGRCERKVFAVRSTSPALLAGMLFTSDGRAMTPHHSRGNDGRQYRYYLPGRDAKEKFGASGVRMLPAGDIEAAVLAHLRSILKAPEIVAGVWREISQRADPVTASMTEIEVAKALGKVEAIWDQLFPLEQHRLLTLLIERVTYLPDALEVKVRPNGIEALLGQVAPTTKRADPVPEEVVA